MIALICFSITKGESFVIGFSSSSDFMIKKFENSVVLKVAKEAISSSELGRCRLLVVGCNRVGIGPRP